jgi:hypothetical protein
VGFALLEVVAEGFVVALVVAALAVPEDPPMAGRGPREPCDPVRGSDGVKRPSAILPVESIAECFDFVERLVPVPLPGALRS